jgi:hypothetical protein
MVDQIKQGDSDELWAHVESRGEPVDLTGATVEVLYRLGSVVTAAEILERDDANGRVRIRKETLPAGPLSFVVHVTKDGARATSPTRSTTRLVVESNMEVV